MGINYILESAMFALLLAQILKVPLRFVKTRKWDLRKCLSTGEAVSSHAALVFALATAIAITDGINSTSFAISIVLAGVVSFDAMGISHHVEEHAKYLNQLQQEFQIQNCQKFKEQVGHNFFEVLIGILIGILVPILFVWCTLFI